MILISNGKCRVMFNLIKLLLRLKVSFGMELNQIDINVTQIE